MKKFPLTWHDYSVYCDLCDDYHGYTTCPNCKEEIWDLDFQKNAKGNAMCPECLFVYAVIDDETLIECEHLDYSLGCSHEYPLSHAQEWECKECPIEPSYMSAIDALRTIQELTKEQLDNDAAEWAKWFAIYDLACKGLGAPIASTRCIEWALKRADELNP